jgi:hypothetical protein
VEIWSGKVAAPRICATKASGYSAMGAASCCNSSADSGTPCPEYPVDPVCAPASNDAVVMTSRKDNVVDKSCFVKVLIIFISPSQKGAASGVRKPMFSAMPHELSEVSVG